MDFPVQVYFSMQSTLQYLILFRPVLTLVRLFFVDIMVAKILQRLTKDEMLKGKLESANIDTEQVEIFCM